MRWAVFSAEAPTAVPLLRSPDRLRADGLKRFRLDSTTRATTRCTMRASPHPAATLNTTNTSSRLATSLPFCATPATFTTNHSAILRSYRRFFARDLPPNTVSRTCWRETAGTNYSEVTPDTAKTASSSVTDGFLHGCAVAR